MLNDGDTLDYAFALRHGEHDGEWMVGHTGSMMGFKADFIRFPEHRLSVAILCNLGSVRQREYTLPVASLFLDAIRQGETERADHPNDGSDSGAAAATGAGS